MRTEIDDTDPSIIYSGSWQLSGNTNEFNGTTHFTGSAGAKLSVSFEGISIEVYGTTTTIEDFPGAVSNYSIDGTNISTFRSPTVATPGYRTQFFKSPTLSDGRHSLLVTLVNRASFYVDSLVINTQDEVKPESMPPPSNPQSTSQGGQQGDTHTATKEKTSIFTSLPPSTTSVSLSLSPSQSPSTPPSPNGFPNTDQGSHTTTSSQSLPTIGGVSQSSPEATGLGPSPKKPVPIGAIAGATAAGVLVVVLAFFFLWRYRRRSVKYTELPKPRPDVASMHKNGVTPFVVSEATPFGDYGVVDLPFRSTYSPSDGPEAPLFAASSSSGHFQNNYSTHSALSDGSVRKSSRHTESTPTPAYTSLQATNPSPLGVGTRNRVSITQSEFDYYQDMMDNLPPPAYYAARLSQ